MTLTDWTIHALMSATQRMIIIIMKGTFENGGDGGNKKYLINHYKLLRTYTEQATSRVGGIIKH